MNGGEAEGTAAAPAPGDGKLTGDSQGGLILEVRHGSCVLCVPRTLFVACSWEKTKRKKKKKHGTDLLAPNLGR